METKKMSLAAIQGQLSRAEMKNVMAGREDKAIDDGGSNKCNAWCKSNSECDSTCPNCEENTNWGNKKMCVR